ncbi:MAG: hypothetical protein ACI87W_003178, partial [Halieaceae bacterium]
MPTHSPLQGQASKKFWKNNGVPIRQEYPSVAYRLEPQKVCSHLVAA